MTIVFHPGLLYQILRRAYLRYLVRRGEISPSDQAEVQARMDAKPAVPLFPSIKVYRD